MLQEFLSQLKTRNLARANRYVVDFGVPAVFQNGNNGSFSSYTQSLNLIRLFCNTTQLPGLSHSTQPELINGEEMERVYGVRNYEDISMTFYCDADFIIKQYMDQWMYSIQDHNSRTLQYFKNYTTQCNIQMLDMQGNAVYAVTLYDIFPKTMNGVELGYAANEVPMLGMTFTYRTWQPTNTLNKKISLPPTKPESNAEKKSFFTGLGDKIGEFIYSGF